jgi:hypothetical protein
MDGEMYVVKLIAMSDRARAVATGVLGVSLKDSQLQKLKELYLVQDLARELQCPPIEVFEQFGKQIRESFAQRALRPFTRFHLSALRDHYDLVGKLLHCGPNDDPLRKLFQYEKMKRTLQKIDSEYALDVLNPPSAAQVLDDILQPYNASSIEQMYAQGQTGWGVIIQREKWLQTDAKYYLKKYADSWNWPADDPMRILATFLEKLELGSAREDADESQAYDFLALTYIRSRLHFLISQLREQAITRANEAIGADPSQLALRNLPAWLEIYERGAIMQALPYLLLDKKPLFTLIPYGNYELLHYSKQPDLAQGFVIKKGNVFKGGGFGTFEIHCSFHGEKNTQGVLRCKDLPIATYKHVIDVIPRLSELDLSPEGDSIGQRLLNTPVLVPDRFLQLLNDSVKSLDLILAQCMVLCGMPLPMKMNIPGYEFLSDQLPYRKLDPEDDMEFSRNVPAIVNSVRKQYRRDPRRLEIVRDIVADKNE